MKAAVLYEYNTPLAVEEVHLEPPMAGEVRVKIVASGVCHSDYLVYTGAVPSPLPKVLGHEGAGIVEEVGPGVVSVKPGDHVVLSAIPYCGRCYYCSMGKVVMCKNLYITNVKGLLLDGTCRLKKGDKDIHHMAGISSFAEYSVVPEAACIRIPDNVPLEKVCLLGCGVITGIGAAVNTARVEAGSSVVVIGCGGVGLNVIQGCALSGAGIIIAVDIFDSKLRKTTLFGATHVINSKQEDVIKTVRKLTDGRGVDYAFEAIGNSKTVEQAYACTRPGGTTIVVGTGSRQEMVSIPLASFLNEKIIKGSAYGSARPHIDIPRIVDLYMNKKLKVDELISHTYSLEEVNRAMDAFEQGEVLRSVVVM